MHRINLEKLVEERTGALRKSEEKFRRLIENLPDNYIFYTITPDRMIEFIVSHENSLGLSTENIRKHISDFFTDNSKNQRTHEYLQKAFEGIPQPMYEVEVYHQDGSKRVLEINESPVSGNDGAVMLVEGIAHDITIQKRAEEEIHELNQFQRSIIDNANIWLFVTDNNLNILIWNKTAERISGYSKEDVIGNNKIWKWLYSDKKYRHWVAKQTVDRVPMGAIIEGLETEIKTRSGETRILSWNSRSLLDKKGKPIGAIALGHDITDRKLIEKVLKEAKEKAELANRAKSVFLANMSHEIRTPMNAILGFTEILKSRIKKAQNREYLSSIEFSGKSLLVLINDILDLARVEAGKLELEYKAFDPRSIFKEMEQIFSEKIKGKKLDFRLNTGSNLPKAIVLDESRLRQILLNLVGNAIKFTNSGYIALSLDYFEPDDASDVSRFIFSVEDTGIGIPQDQRETIFGAFEQQKGQSNLAFGGTGLGLAITKRLVTMMNGSIKVSGEVDKGTRFTVEIKNVKTASISSDLFDKKDIDVNSIVFKNARILIVDDIENNRNLFNQFFRGV